MPVTRVVNLLKEMQNTLKKEMDEDEELYTKLECWCSTNDWEKGNKVAELESKIAELNAEIERLTAKSAELKELLKELADKIEALKKELAEATALREKELKAFHGGELDSIQGIENLKAAIMVLDKHHVGKTTLPNLKTEKDSWDTSFIALGSKHSSKDFPWSPDHESSLDRSLDTFMAKSGMDVSEAAPTTDRVVQKFLQQSSPVEVAVRPRLAATATEDTAVVQRALKSAAAFMQAKHGYVPSYNAQSGEILGILKQLLDEMSGDLAEAQKEEQEKAAAFAELREAREAEIAAAEKQSEEKEDELAQTDMDNANAKEDLERFMAELSETQKFLLNLKKTCEEAAENFALRKKARLEEIKAVSETIEILTADEARDAMSGTYNFVQLSSRVHRIEGRRLRAAAVLRAQAVKTHNPELSALATTVELDAFTKVKKAIDDMIVMLKKQQEDEVKHRDWCNVELHETNMTAMKTEDLIADLEAKIEELGITIKRLGDEIPAAKTSIADLQGNLQRASIDRQKANLDFQQTVADQRATQEVLAKALDRLATYYDKELFLQGKKGAKQTPPVPQMEYKPSAGATGVMSMIEKLIYEAKDLEADSVKGEAEAQAQYETMVADTNGSVLALQEEITTKTKAVSQAKKDKAAAEEDHLDAIDELERLTKYAADLHTSCDFVLKNFMIRQEARAQEIEALQQAKQILSGADLS